MEDVFPSNSLPHWRTATARACSTWCCCCRGGSRGCWRTVGLLLCSSPYTWPTLLFFSELKSIRKYKNYMILKITGIIYYGYYSLHTCSQGLSWPIFLKHCPFIVATKHIKYINYIIYLYIKLNIFPFLNCWSRNRSLFCIVSIVHMESNLSRSCNNYSIHGLIHMSAISIFCYDMMSQSKYFLVKSLESSAAEPSFFLIGSCTGFTKFAKFWKFYLHLQARNSLLWAEKVKI